MSSLIDYRKISVSLIATVFNEQNNILEFLKSYRKQSSLAKEFIIVDAFSSDETYSIMQKFSRENAQLNIRLFQQKSNRSQARNFAVGQAKSNYLAFTDAGCILDPSWLEELLKKLISSQKEVVGGYFQGIAKNHLEEAIVPYFLQLNKGVSEKNFTPTTRSFLIQKKLWQKFGGLNENLELSEDYQLMLRLKQGKIAIAFAKKAIVFWYPPKTFGAFFKKITAFAKSDIEAGIIRPKVLSIFARYLLFILIYVANPLVFLLVLLLYIYWSISKNLHNCPNSWYYLPVLQISSDLGIMAASLLALPKFNSRDL